MPRNMSFMLTTEQIRSRTKTVTRRLGWWFLEPGDELNACVKCQGLKAGERPEVLARIRVVSCGLMPLDYICRAELIRSGTYSHDWPALEVAKEGFPGMPPAEFVAMFCKHMKCEPSIDVNRIEFEYL